jgi:ubiquinone/menaquinone biosynthesis C-methylase UbiE
MKEKEYLKEVRDYYDTHAEAIKDCFCDTYQAYLLPGEGDSGDQSSTNTFLASRAGIKPGDRVLDAGCGAGGPAVDIAKNISGVTIDAITISRVQARLARKLVEENGLAGRIRVHTGDFHELPFEPATFDLVYFFESDAYSWNQKNLFAGVCRVLRPGGILYIKGVYKKDGPLSEQETIDLDKMCKMFAWNMTTLGASAKAIAEAGFQDIETGRLDFLSARAFFQFRLKASVTTVDGTPSLTLFGKRHHDIFKSGPWYAGEIRARKPQ